MWVSTGVPGADDRPAAGPRSRCMSRGLGVARRGGAVRSSGTMSSRSPPPVSASACTSPVGRRPAEAHRTRARGPGLAIATVLFRRAARPFCLLVGDSPVWPGRCQEQVAPAVAGVEPAWPGESCSRVIAAQARHPRCPTTMRALAVGFDRSAPSSTAVANIALAGRRRGGRLRLRPAVPPRLASGTGASGTGALADAHGPARGVVRELRTPSEARESQQRR